MANSANESTNIPPTGSASTSSTVSPASRSRHPLAVGVLIGVVGTAVVAAVVVGPLILAHRQDLPLEQRYGSYAVTMAAKLGAATVGSPPTESPRGLTVGRAAYTGACASC